MSPAAIGVTPAPFAVEKHKGNPGRRVGRLTFAVPAAVHTCGGTGAVRRRLRRIHTRSVEAYEVYVRAKSIPYPPVKERIARARDMFETVRVEGRELKVPAMTR